VSGWDWLLTAAGLMLIAEGLLPFVNPDAWRRVVEQALRLPNAQLRLIGLASIGAGVLLLLWV